MAAMQRGVDADVEGEVDAAAEQVAAEDDRPDADDDLADAEALPEARRKPAKMPMNTPPTTGDDQKAPGSSMSSPPPATSSGTESTTPSTTIAGIVAEVDLAVLGLDGLMNACRASR